LGNDILKLYPQFTKLTDRRQQSESVDSERRSGEDRRQSQRIVDPKLNPEITNVRNAFNNLICNTDQYKNTVKALDNITIKDKETTKAVFAALSPITPVRRISSLPDNMEDGNYTRAAGIIGLAIANLPEDWRDIKSAGKQIFKGIKPDYDYKNYQHSFSFFRGTFLEPLLNLKGKYGEKLSYFLKNTDKSLDDTKFGKLIGKIFKFKIDYENPELIKRIEKSGEKKVIYAYKIEGNFLARVIGKSLFRIPLLSVIALSLLELPKVAKTFTAKKNTDNRFKSGLMQTIKSGIYVTSMLANIGIFGALLAGFGPAGSLIGMGIGSIIGTKISQKLNTLIDKS